MDEIKTIEEYINQYGDNQDTFKRLNEFYDTIRAVIPNASQKISWGMPTFFSKGNIIHFACHKNHIGLYPGVDAIIKFEKQIKEYKHSKGAIQMPYSKPFPKELIAAITKFCADENEKLNK